MSTTRQNGLNAIELTGTEYTVEEVPRDYGVRYEVTNVAGDTVLRGHEAAGGFPFVDADGNEVCTATSPSNVHIAGEYVLTDSQTEEDVVILDNGFSLVQDTWRIRDADDRSLLGEINSRGALYTLARKLLPVGKWIAHEYEITDADGEPVGSIVGEHAMYDRYEISINNTSSVPTEAIVVATILAEAY